MDGGVDPEDLVRDLEPLLRFGSEVQAVAPDWLFPCHMTQSALGPPADKALTLAKSLDVCGGGGGGPRKKQVKVMSSCPLLQPSPDPGPASGSPAPPEPEYSLPFDTVTGAAPRAGRAAGPGAASPDPLYDSIDEALIRNIFLGDGGSAPRRVEHIYDEPEGCAAPRLQEEHACVYDEPQEATGDAWRFMAAEPKGHDPRHNPEEDYAVPQRLRRKEEEAAEQAKDLRDSPYSNVTPTEK